MPADAPIVIAGAGPVGLSLAVGLARRGVRSIVLETKPELSAHSKAVLVSTRTLEILNEWGLFETFKENSQWLEKVNAIDSRSKQEFIELNFDCLRPISPCAGFCILPQDKTEHLLYEACVASGLVEVRFAHTLVAFDSDETGVRVRVQGPQGQYVLETPYLCGCDGAHSAVREGLGLKLEGKTYNAHAVLADVLIKDERDQLPWPRADLHADALSAILRFAPGYWRVIIAQRGEGESGAPDAAYVQRKIDSLLGPGPIEIVWSSAFRIHCRNAPHYRVGRVLLLGDAAHLNSPAGGQGMNAGIHDTHNLAWKLDLALRGGDTELLLKSYDAERYDAIVHNVDVATDRLTRIGISAPGWVRAFAARLASWLGRFPHFQLRMAKAAGILNFRYDESDLIDRSGGRFLPDIPLGDGLRLRTVVGINGGLVEVVQDGAKLSFGDSTYELSSSAAEEIRRAGGPFIAVRPDHVVAYAGGERDRAESYLRLWSLAGSPTEKVS